MGSRHHIPTGFSMRLLLLAVILSSPGVYFLRAQAVTRVVDKGDSLGVFPRWHANEKQSYDIRSSWITFRENSPSGGERKGYLDVTIVDSSANGYRILWEIRDHPGGSAPGSTSTSDVSTPLKIEFVVDVNGFIKEIVNGGEFRNASSGESRMLSPLRAIMAIQMYYRPYGFWYSPAQIQSFSLVRKVPGTNHVVGFKALAELAKVYETEQKYLLLVRMIPDSTFGHIVADYVAGLDDLLEEYDVEELTSWMKANVSDWYLLDERSSRILGIRRRVEIRSGHFSHVEDLTLTSPQEEFDTEAIPPAAFVAVDRAPKVISSARPDYPDLAMRARLEGTVWVNIWVDARGKPRDVSIFKSEAEVFNEPSIRAAKGFLFTPARLNNKSVPVWVSIPFNFKLQRD